jgi:hypothetical protein
MMGSFRIKSVNMRPVEIAGQNRSNGLSTAVEGVHRFLAMTSKEQSTDRLGFLIVDDRPEPEPPNSVADTLAYEQ